jgi:hypothetical protein
LLKNKNRANHDRDYEPEGREFESLRARQFLNAVNLAPFLGVMAFGSDADLRGCKSGTYRGNFLLAAQAEYRHRFTRRFGAAF